jgi:hypothetical protein
MIRNADTDAPTQPHADVALIRISRMSDAAAPRGLSYARAVGS